MSPGIKPNRHGVYGVAFAVVSSLSATVVFADTVILSPAAWASARDGGTSTSPVVDGQFDALIAGKRPVCQENPGYGKIPIGIPRGIRIRAAGLGAPAGHDDQQRDTNGSAHEPDGRWQRCTDRLRSVAGSTITLADFSGLISVAQTSLFNGLPSSSSSISVPYYMQAVSGQRQ